MNQSSLFDAPFPPALTEGLASLSPAWQTLLQQPVLAPVWPTLQARLDAELQAGATVYPADPWFALRLLQPEQVRVVILGQDPYHGPGQAHGLAFSVPEGVKPPPSLRNMFKEISRDFGTPPPASGNLQRWAAQGVLLLNTVLTVRHSEAASHRGWGWEAVTDALLQQLAQRQPCAFLLWGSDAQRKRELLRTPSSLVLEAPHPSPLSAHRGFIGCGHFSQVNQWLHAQGGSAIDW